MKRILCLAVVLSISGSLYAASKVACRNCGVRDNNIIIRCEKGHMSCSKCARSRDLAESMMDSIKASWGQGGTSQRCTFVNRYDDVCGASISKIIADNRSPEVIRKEKEIARQKAQRAAEAKAQAEKKRQAGVNALKAEHNALVKGLPQVIRSKSTTQLKSYVQKMLNHHSKHDGFGSKRGSWLLGMLGGTTGGESCNILNHMVNIALRLKNDAQIQILLANINPGDSVVIAGLKTGRPVYVRLFANKLKSQKLFNTAADTIVDVYTRDKNPLYIRTLVQQLKNAKFDKENRYGIPEETPLEKLLAHFLKQEKILSLEALKPLYDAVKTERLEKYLPLIIAKNDANAYRYLIDQRKVTGIAEVRQDGLMLYPYHLLLIKNDFTYARKVKFSSTLFEESIKLSRENNDNINQAETRNKGKKREKEVTPVEYMAELNNFPAVKFLIEEEGYEFGTFSNYTISKNALEWAEKHKNKEMEMYLDDNISGWATAGVWTTNILLAPLWILILLAGR